MSRGLLRSVAVVGTGTALSRVLGFVREILMAVFFGTHLAKSAFDVAFMIPNLFRRLFGEGALSAAFVPVFTETLEREGREEANRLVARVGTMLGVALAAIVLGGVLLVLAAEQSLSLGPKSSAVLPLLRTMLPYMFFICLVALAMGTLNAFGHFAVPAYTPVLLNVVWIGTLVWVCPRFGRSPGEQIQGLALGILAGGAIQLLAQIPALLRYGVRPGISFAWADAKVKRILVLMGPAALGMGIHQVNTVIDRLLALWVADWAPAALTYAERLIYLPLGVFATAMGTVLLPTFSRQATREEQGAMRETLGTSLRQVSLLMIPAAVGLIVLARPIVELAFAWQGGRFDGQSSLQTARAVAFYGPGLLVFSIYKVLVPAFYGLKDTRTPVKVGAWVVALNLGLNVLFILTWPAGFKHAGLAFATVLASAVNCVALAVLLQRRVGSPGWGRIATTVVKALVGAVLMGLLASGCHTMMVSALTGGALNAKFREVLAVGVAIVAGMAVYARWVAVVCRNELKERRA